MSVNQLNELIFSNIKEIKCTNKFYNNLLLETNGFIIEWTEGFTFRGVPIVIDDSIESCEIILK